MAQTGFTPIQIYSSSTAAAAPVAGSLTNSTLGSELAINITDGKLFYKDNANAVQVIGWKIVPTTAGGTGLTSYAQGDLLYYNSGTTLTALTKNTTATRYLSNTGTNNDPAWAQINLANGVTGTLPTGNGGTGLTSFTANGIVYASSVSALATGGGLTFDGTNFATTGYATIQSSARISYASNTASFQNISAVTFGLGGTTGGVTSNYYQGDNAQFYPTTDNSSDLGIGSNRWKNLSISGSATLPSVTVSGGTINGTSVGATTASTGSFTSCAATTAFRETNGNTSVANGGTFNITIPTVRRPQLLVLYSNYNLNQGWYGLVKGDGSGAVQTNAIVDNGGLTVTGNAGNTITITNGYGGTANIRWSLLPLGLGV
jgi:hypothetical protein